MLGTWMQAVMCTDIWMTVVSSENGCQGLFSKHWMTPTVAEYFKHNESDWVTVTCLLEMLVCTFRNLKTLFPMVGAGGT